MTEFMSEDAQRRCTWQCVADLVSAAVASAFVAPWVTAIDKMVYYRAAYNASLTSSVRSWLASPKPSLSSFWLPFLVYFGTYATANMFDSINAENNCSDPSSVSATSSKFFATAAVSTGLCVYKDGYYAGLASRSPAPLMTYLLFTARDAVTVYASFNLPTLIAPKLAQVQFPSFAPFASIFGSEESRLRAAQIMMPAAAQLVTTPLHLLGLDLSTRQYRLPIRERISAIRQHFCVATPLRMIRIIPGFGIGSVVNTSCRTSMSARVF
ncbi:hypothetical protein B0J13DRAFT_593786 [Dactylonectria estremocensis]|uniref:Sequence orphan n=1 Tax=Dactylonectria estremocensis TaxID=1079267 RepID=A0A9P9F987_9HYPO|nr:hypothetical protein B0J13DRAFT_593786 [Dactylonectria estremocensis]